MPDNANNPLIPCAIVFGASGFIGSHVIEQLLLAGFSVTGAVRANSDCRFLRSIDVPIVEVDFTDQTSLQQAIDGHTLVYNCLAERNMQLPLKQLRAVEVDLTARLMHAAKAANAHRFIQLSTIQVYGFERPPLPIDESFPPCPHYAFSKACAEREDCVKNTARELGLDYVLLRPVNALGSRDQKLQAMLNAHRQGWFMTIGDNPRFSAIDVRDIGRAMALLGTNPAACNNTWLVKGFDTSWLDFKQALDQSSARRSRILCLPKTLAYALGWLGEQLPRRWQVPLSRFSIAVMATDTLFDDSRIRALGFLPRYDLHDAVASLLERSA